MSLVFRIGQVVRPLLFFSTPKLVLIRDWKLGLAFWFLQSCVVCYLCVRILLLQSFLVSQAPILVTNLRSTEGKLYEKQTDSWDMCSNSGLSEYSYVFSEGA